MRVTSYYLRAGKRLPPQGKRRPEGSVLRLEGDGPAFKYPRCRRSRYRTDPSRRGRPDQGRPSSPLRMTKMVGLTGNIASVCLGIRMFLFMLCGHLCYAVIQCSWQHTASGRGLLFPSGPGCYPVMPRTAAGDFGPSTPWVSSRRAALLAGTSQNQSKPNES